MDSKANQVYVTRSGLPLRIALDWPFHRSHSGADFHVLHGTVSLENSDDLLPSVHALVALQLTVTVREVLPSLEPRDAETPAINTVRKAVDRKELEFLKTPKRVPVPFNSRAYDFKRSKWAFGEASDEERAALLLRKVFWETKQGASRVYLCDLADAQYLDTTPEHLVAVARRLPGLRVSGEYAEASPELMARAAEIEHQARTAREELEKKHAFERG
ncbi:MAG: hypothetical protein LAN64_17945 [Acidobacteriia bacterium]|nr:hypothetical protein [Terriglobia bacterium]